MTDLGGNSREQLKSIIERVENVETEIAERQSDRRDIYGEAKGNGFDVRALKAIIRYRKEDAKDREEREAIFDMYLSAMGEA